MPGHGGLRAVAAAPGARHRAPEPDPVDQLTDTVVISSGCFTYGRHAAYPSESVDTNLAAGLGLQPATMIGARFGAPGSAPPLADAAANTVRAAVIPPATAQAITPEAGAATIAGNSPVITRIGQALAKYLLLVRRRGNAPWYVLEGASATSRSQTVAPGCRDGTTRYGMAWHAGLFRALLRVLRGLSP
jgi:hypothetical protein